VAEADPQAEPERPWYFGVACERCSYFLPVSRDPSDGHTGARFAHSGTIIATCSSCGHRGRYAVNRISQRRAEPKR
jgi:RNase P subunit RPR2